MTDDGLMPDISAESNSSAPKFIGRAWLVEVVQEWIRSGTGHLFITGRPGTGKSAAIDFLWGNRTTEVSSAAVYRCRASDRRSCDPVRFAESLAEQFSHTIPGFTDALLRVSTELSGRPGEVHIEGSAHAETVHPHGSVIGVHISISNVSADEAFDRLVDRPLRRLAPDPLPIVVVDALDEALTYRGHRTIAELVLERATGLPLRFVITSRHDARILAAKEGVEGAVSVDLVADAPDANADLVEYALHRLEYLIEDEHKREMLARELAANAAGNYLYVYHVTEEFVAGRRDPAQIVDFQVLPKGLEDLYRQFLRREIRPIGNTVAEDRWRTEFRPVLSLLVSAQEDGFSTTQLADILDCSRQAVMDVIQVLGQYLLGESPGPWSLYHRSFADFLLQGPDAQLDAAGGHQRIIDYAFERWAAAWETCEDTYYLRHLPDHLMMALESPSLARTLNRTFRNRLYTLATSAKYLNAQHAVDPVREPQLATIALALESSLTTREYERVTLLALSLARAQSAADSITPVQAALEWGIEAGVTKARTYPEDISLLWHLLIMAALGFNGRTEAPSVATTIQRSGFGTIDRHWSPVAAALMAPFIPVLDIEHAQAILQIADDLMLGYLALFLMEGIAPDFSIIPALWIEENLLRARAITEIFRRAVVTGGNIETLPKIGDLVMDNYVRQQQNTDRLLGLEDKEYELKTYLLGPDVPDSVLVAEAARGNFQQARQELTADIFHSFYTSGNAVLLGMIVNAVVHGGQSIEQVRHAGEQALEEQPADIWSILHYTNYLHTLDDSRVPALLERIVELSRASDDDYMWGTDKGHVDAFHGRQCNIGLKLAIIQALCAAGRITEARSEAEQLREENPAEFIRALSYVRNATPDVDVAGEVLDAAQQVVAAAPHDMERQAMLALVDRDLDRLLGTVCDTLVHIGNSTKALRLSSIARSVLAWAAYLRGDNERAALLGRAAYEQFCGMPREMRSGRVRDRLVKNLLRARLPDIAATVYKTDANGRYLFVLLPIVDVQHELIMSGELEELKMLRQALSQGAEPTDDNSLDSQALLVRFLRASGNSKALVHAEVAARAQLENAIEQMTNSIRQERKGYYYSSYRDEDDAAKLALLAADLGEPGMADTALGLMHAWAHEAEMNSMGWDAFRGYFPRHDETMQEYEDKFRRRSHMAAHLAEAYYRAGDSDHATASFETARKYAEAVSTTRPRSDAFTVLAEIAARCGWYKELDGLWPLITRARGSELGSIAELLVVTSQQERPDAAGAKRALDTVLLLKSLANLDHVDLLSLIAVLSLDPAIEAQLIAACSDE